MREFNRFTRVGMLVGSLAIFMGAQSASASSLCAGGTLAAYANTSCAIGNILFTFGGTPYIYNPDDTNVAASAVTVTPFGSGTVGDPTGFTFTAAGWTASNPDSSGNHSADINITFAAAFDSSFNSTLSNFINTTLTLGVNIANQNGNTGVLAGESVADQNNNALPNINLTIVGNNDATSLGLGGTALTGTSNFSATAVGINKDINLLATDSPNSVQVNSILETFTYATSVVPEPGTIVLMGAGLGLVLLIRRRKGLFGVLSAVVLLIGLSSGSADASTCTTTDLQTYITNGSCTIGDALFSGFFYSGSGSSGATVPSASQVSVVPSQTGGNITLQFVPVTTVTGTNNASISISFNVLLTQPTIGFSALDTVTHAGSGAFTSSGSTLAEGVTTLATESFNCNSTTCSTGGSTPFVPNVAGSTPMSVTNTFNLSSSGLGLTNSAHISNLTNTIMEATAVPEPTTFGLLGSALIGLGLFVRRRAAARR